jgi:hypothetical protein
MFRPQDGHPFAQSHTGQAHTGQAYTSQAYTSQAYTAQARKITSVGSSIGKKHSMRTSSKVTSRGVPSVAIVVN